MIGLIELKIQLTEWLGTNTIQDRTRQFASGGSVFYGVPND